MRTSLLLSVLLLGACQPDAAPVADEAADTSRITLGTGDTPHRAAPPDPAEDELRDIGIGVLHLGMRPDSVTAVREDTILVRNAPTDEAAVIARWIHSYGDDGTWEYRLETNEAGLLRNDIEWSYEANGLPVDTVAANGAWARVLHAVDVSGDPRLGWVRMRERTRIEQWTHVLTQQNVYFRRPDSLAFHASPGGDTVSLAISAGDTHDGLDYTMAPLQTSDGWMQVEVTTPSNYCADVADARSDTVWIRHIDERGRPRVWYYPRGC